MSTVPSVLFHSLPPSFREQKTPAKSPSWLQPSGETEAVNLSELRCGCFPPNGPSTARPMSFSLSRLPLSLSIVDSHSYVHTSRNGGVQKGIYKYVHLSWPYRSGNSEQAMGFGELPGNEYCKLRLSYRGVLFFIRFPNSRSLGLLL